jgi:hypothetical protein
MKDNSLIPLGALLVIFPLEIKAFWTADRISMLVVYHVGGTIQNWISTLSAKLVAIHDARLC